MGDTKIEWTDKTWNPTRGCTRVSEGCRNCYAERVAMRQIHDGYRGLVQLANGHPQWTGVVRAMTGKSLEAPLHWKKPCRIFVNSMSDLFHEALSDEAIDRVFAIMALCPQHTFQVLTKRPARMLQWATRTRGNHCVEVVGVGTGNVRSGSWIDPLDNVWLGVSVEDQATADERVPLLLKTPAAVRFVSYEPALGPVDFSRIPIHKASGEEWDPVVTMNALNRASVFAPRLDWVIVGGESGPGARPFDVQWAREIVTACSAAMVACFVKQMGAHVIQDGERRIKRDKKGGDWHEWPHDVRVREFPNA